jgi:hypothetical protein
MGWRPRDNEVRLMIIVDSSVWIDYFNGNPTWQPDHSIYFFLNPVKDHKNRAWHPTVSEFR